jgi:5-formyltetrahydrofolate cyclo-ligase
MRMRRRMLTPVRRRLATAAITRHLLSLPAYRRAQKIALYWPADGEPDVRGLVSHARTHGKRIYLPVVGNRGDLHFAAWPAGGALRRNRYGIPEPAGIRHRVTAAQLDLVIVPLVAFDAIGNRLGMGGGYYDRALAGRRHRRVLVGAAFSFQQAPAVPAQPWDIPLDVVITEHGRRRRVRGAFSKEASR